MVFLLEKGILVMVDGKSVGEMGFFISIGDFYKGFVVVWFDKVY